MIRAVFTFIRHCVLFCVQCVVKYVSMLCYRFKYKWLGPEETHNFRNLRCIILLNHTSLYEFVIIALASHRLLWNVARRGMLPVADITHRKKEGLLLRWMAAEAPSISRKRDETWSKVLDADRLKRPLYLLAPEGRMKRLNGLDKHGNPMTVRGGIADVLSRLDGGRMLIIFSGGLHHVAPPGRRVPKLFKRIYVALESLDIQRLKQEMGFGGENFRANLLNYLQDRMREVCEPMERSTYGGTTVFRA